jgi:hypothetical protein
MQCSKACPLRDKSGHRSFKPIRATTDTEFGEECRCKLVNGVGFRQDQRNSTYLLGPIADMSSKKTPAHGQGLLYQVLPQNTVIADIRVPDGALWNYERAVGAHHTGRPGEHWHERKSRRHECW